MVTTGAVDIATVTGTPAAGQRAEPGADDSVFAQLLGGAVSGDAAATPASTGTPGQRSGNRSARALAEIEIAQSASPSPDMLALCGLPVTTPAFASIPASIPEHNVGGTDPTVSELAGTSANALANTSASTPANVGTSVQTPVAGIDPAWVSPLQTAAVPVNTHTDPATTARVADGGDVRTAQRAADLQWLKGSMPGDTALAAASNAEAEVAVSAEAGNVTQAPPQAAPSVVQQAGKQVVRQSTEQHTEQSVQQPVAQPIQQLVQQSDRQVTARSGQHMPNSSSGSIELPVVPDSTAVTTEQRPVVQKLLTQVAPMIDVMTAQLREAGIDRSVREVILNDAQNIVGSLNTSGLQPAGTQLASDASLFEVAPRHHLQATVGTHQWATELGNKLTMMATRDTQSATLYMTPADLGPVQVRIDLNQDQASVWFTAEHAETRSALEQSLPKLREMFAAQGMSLTDAGVFGDRPRQQQTDASFTPARMQSFQYQDSEALADTATVRTISLGLLDAYA